jgi:hypothetical protein
MAEFPTVETNERFYSRDGKLYLVRDVRVNGKLVRVENATLCQEGEYATLTWHPAQEGMRFADMKPLSSNT